MTRRLLLIVLIKLLQNKKMINLYLFSCRVFLLPVSMSDSDEYGKTEKLIYFVWI